MLYHRPEVSISEAEEGEKMDLRLTGKCALVTGSTAGIGLATASKLAEEGASVMINERVEEAVRKVREGAPEAEVSGASADLGTAKGIEELLRQVPETDILINNLGIFEPKDFGEITDDDWFRFFETNVMSGVRLARHYLPGMMERNWGRIVFVSSESAVHIPPEMIHYGVTKTAQLAVARGLAETTVGTYVPKDKPTSPSIPRSTKWERSGDKADVDVAPVVTNLFTMLFYEYVRKVANVVDDFLRQLN